MLSFHLSTPPDPGHAKANIRLSLQCLPVGGQEATTRFPSDGENLMQGKEQPRSLVNEAKEQVVEAVQGAGDVTAATVDAVSNTIVHALSGTRAAGTEVIGLAVDTVTGAVKGAAQIGMDTGHAAKSIMMGTLNGAKQVGVTSVETVSASAGALVKGTSEVGGDVGKAAKGAVEGAIHAARDIGVTAEQAASAAGSGALRAAGEVGSTAAEQVQKVLTKTISGVKVVIREPFQTRKEIKDEPRF